MIAVNKEEKNAIRERFPNVHIVRTMKQKSKRHRYYCEESRGVLNLLNEMRGGDAYRKEGGNYRDKKNGKRISA